MKLSLLLTGPETDLAAMLDAREQRAAAQQRLLDAFPMTLVSFTMNIPGPHKVFPLAVQGFEEGLRLLTYYFRSWGFPICHREIQRPSTGCQAFFSTSAPPEAVKQRLVWLEDHCPLGRLFDLDVLDPQGQKISRQALGLPGRTCLICSGPVFLCSRSRAHSLTELLEKTCRILLDYFDEEYARRVSGLAVRALLQEVRTTPKPGLVDLDNSGAHSDMDETTFEESALSLMPWFQRFVLYGIRQEDRPLSGLLPGLRELGMQAEVHMLLATGGVNTHKGLIFSMGILLCSLGCCRSRGLPLGRVQLQQVCRQISSPLSRDFPDLKGMTHGECSYRSHGVTGARGQAMAGFPTLFSAALPALDRWEGNPGAGTAALLEIMAVTQDTNVISRSSCQTAQALRGELADFLSQAPSMDAILDYARKLDQRLIRKNISPGGSADLLALGFFLKLLERNSLL